MINTCNKHIQLYVRSEIRPMWGAGAQVRGGTGAKEGSVEGLECDYKGSRKLCKVSLPSKLMGKTFYALFLVGKISESLECEEGWKYLLSASREPPGFRKGLMVFRTLPPTHQAPLVSSSFLLFLLTSRKATLFMKICCLTCLIYYL